VAACRRPIIRRSLSSDPLSPASKVATVNLDMASQNGLSQTFLCRCFEVPSTEVTALMTVDDGRTLSCRNCAPQCRPTWRHYAAQPHSHSSRRWNLIFSPSLARSGTSLKCRRRTWTLQSDLGDVSLGGCATLRPPTARRYTRCSDHN